MRWILAGLLLLSMSSAALAQATGEVQSIGFNGTYRPDCWVPMVVRLKPDTADAGNYQIRVYQHDLDGDRAVYVRPITLNGSATAAEQLFGMYFLPQPIDKGLPDQTSGSLRDLQKDLQVFLCDAKGKQLAQLPVTSTLNNVDPYRDSYSQRPRAARLILSVSGNGSQQPPLGDLARTLGLMQDVEVVNLRERDLPEDPLGYEPVDAVLWLDGDPADLDAGGSHGLSALQDYVRFGGQLIVTQPTGTWQQTAGFGDLMPVDVQGVGNKQTFEPLRSMAVGADDSDGLADATGAWGRVRPPFQMARSTARPGTGVELWIDWKEDGSYADATPYLARRAFGLGQVTWVAQPLTVDVCPTNAAGWPYVWARVLGWRNDAYVPPPLASNANSPDDPTIKKRLERYRPGSPVDLGFPLVQGLNLGSKGAWLIVLAIGFFVVYWLVAGPGTYAYLISKKQQGLSWFFFAAAALVATAVTVAVVKLVLRGPPEVRHLSMVRVAPGQPAVVYSRFGLYIPRDGTQTVELQNTAPNQLSYLSPLAEHPQQLGDVSEFPAPLDYDVPVRDLASADAPLLSVPYRSSLKKFQARWVGELSPKVTADTVLRVEPDDARVPLRGTLANNTGKDLTDVYLAFNLTGDRDWVIYLPTWAKGQRIDVKRDLVDHVFLVDRETDSPLYATPGTGKAISDELVPRGYRADPKQNGWANFWFGQYRNGATLGSDNPERDTPGLETAFPMLSLIGRLPPMPNVPGGGHGDLTQDRSEFFARGARMLDVGPSLQAGQLVVLAAAKGPLPVPVQVDGDAVTGDGVTLYQFLLPLDRGTAEKPSTKPSAER